MADARSYLAALAETALTFDAAMEYERMLLELDELHGGVYPPATVVPVTEPPVLYEIAYNAIAGLGDHDVNPLGLELCLAMLIAACETDTRP